MHWVYVGGSSSFAMMALSAPESMKSWTGFPSIMPGLRIGGAVKDPNRHGMLTRLILRQASALWPFSPHLIQVTFGGSPLLE